MHLLDLVLMQRTVSWTFKKGKLTTGLTLRSLKLDRLGE